MNDLLNLKPMVLFWKINPQKATTGGEAGWMVDCEIAELTKFANLGHYLATFPSPLALWALYAREIFKTLWLT